MHISNEPSMLEVRNLHTHYDRFAVLHDINFDLAEGQFLGIVGRNGVGKTTLLKSLAGAVKPSSGSIRLKAEELSGLDATRVARRGISLVLDRKGIFGSLSVHENLLVALRLGSNRQMRWTLQGVLTLFPRLAERIDAPGKGLSGGEQQMLAIARALLTQPELLLFDEPTEGLAPKIVEELVHLLKELSASGQTAIVVDQRLETVFDTCHEILVMRRGSIAAKTTSEELQADTLLLKEYLGV
jgi:branched-chain amino acid transport system ATP-binding protein